MAIKENDVTILYIFKGLRKKQWPSRENTVTFTVNSI
jgi:hypothetical protein